MANHSGNTASFRNQSYRINTDMQCGIAESSRDAWVLVPMSCGSSVVCADRKEGPPHIDIYSVRVILGATAADTGDKVIARTRRCSAREEVTRVIRSRDLAAESNSCGYSQAFAEVAVPPSPTAAPSSTPLVPTV
jgi:hypothetical protein